MKAFLILILIVFFAIPVFSQIASLAINTSTSIGGGLGLGAVIAVIASWSRNQSILWAIIHAFFGWFYVIYYVLTR